MPLHIVVLAAGLGKRMLSATPKVLHPIGGKAMLARVIETALQLNPEQLHVVVGQEKDQIQQKLNDYPVNWILQAEPLGTGHALLQALPHIPPTSLVLVLSGDVPLIRAETLQKLIDEFYSVANPSKLGLLLAYLDDPFGLGRIIRDSKNQVKAIVEERDATTEQRLINEIYSGICCANAADLNRWLPKLDCDNAQKEYYLPGILTIAIAEHTPVYTLHTTRAIEILGINNRVQLHSLERALQHRLTEELMLAGVTFADAARVDIRGELHCGKDVFIDVNVVFHGQVTLATGCVIGPNCVLKNVTLGANCIILASTVMEDCQLEADCQIGPFARLRPGTQLARACKVGNFVEMKQTKMGEKSKVNHLSYLGDALIGQHVNIGAGTITCNYDGVNKHQTIIEDGANIGSDTQLVAPVTVGKNATIGAGSTIRKNVPANELTLSVSTQKTIFGWKRKRAQNPS